LDTTYDVINARYFSYTYIADYYFALAGELKLKKILAFITLLFFIAVITQFQCVRADDYLEDEPFAAVLANNENSNNKLPKINALSAIVMDVESGRVLFEKNAYSKMPMASTTKIMTAIVALENGSLDDTVTVSKRAASVWGSTINLKTGDKLKLRDMMYGLLLNSGNDAAIAIAEHIGGTVENFLKMMNRKAGLIGARNTSFKSPHGLDMAGHYSTAYDLALITRYALENPTFSEIVRTRSVSILNKSLHNTNEMLDIYPGADGVKTGYTGQAGRCLVTSATRDNWRIISVVLNCSTRNKRAQSSKSILNYAFNNYKPYTVQEAGQSVTRLKVYRGTDDWVDVKTSDEINIPLKESEINCIEKKVVLPDIVAAPVYAGTGAGSIQYSLNGEILAESELKIWSDVGRKGYIDYLGDIFHGWCRMLREGIF